MFVGAKMLLADFYKIPTLTSLLVIIGLLAVAVVASLLHARRPPKPQIVVAESGRLTITRNLHDRT